MTQRETQREKPKGTRVQERGGRYERESMLIKEYLGRNQDIYSGLF